jgi:hypothetical protein
MVQEPAFVLDREGLFFCLDTGRIITGVHIEYLLPILNSKLFFFAIKKFYGGGGLGESGVRMKHTFFEKFSIPKYYRSIDQQIGILIKTEQYQEIDKIIYAIYKLNEEEINFIESQ